MINRENESFASFDNEIPGLIFDDSGHKEYPIRYYNVVADIAPQIEQDKSYFGYVYSGGFLLDQGEVLSQSIMKGYYFSINGKDSKTFRPMTGSNDKMILIEVLHEAGVYPKTGFYCANLVGGPLEKKGRLKYIDGCTDSLLIPPVKLGDPCFNHLHFPENIDQTAHTHPSHRIGMVTSGHGECITPFGTLALETNMIFVIKAHDGITDKKGLDGKMYPIGTHKFKTNDSIMNVVAFHPDTDFGATDVDHPMINRTMVGGQSANSLEDIRTK